MLYALAVSGGSIAYVPFLTLILPSRLTELAGTSDVAWVAYAAFFGAIMASLANIMFGLLSDYVRNRRVWIWFGLFLSSAILVSFPVVTTLHSLIAFVILWQLALNMMLSPLAAWAGDSVPDSQKGMLGGLLALAPALGALSGAIVTFPELAGFESRLWIIAAMVIGCVLPVLLFGKPARFEDLEPAKNPREPSHTAAKHRTKMPGKTVIHMWVSRLLIQICEATLFAYIFFWFRSVDQRLGDDDTAQILSAVVIVAVPVAMVVGRWTDRHNRPIAPLAICALVTAIGLTMMSLLSAPTLGLLSPVGAIASYAVVGIAASVFLSLHTSQTLRVLPKPETRGRDLGIFNLTNTAPSLIMPWLVLMLIPIFGFAALLAVLALLALLAAILLWSTGKPV